MSDRELLELASKAAGYAIHARRQADRDRDYPEQIGLWIPDESTCWNPLIDSGHALRLAVKLKLRICPYAANPEGIAYVSHDSFCEGVTSEHAGDPYAATRRAIVRAAASMATAQGGAK